MIMKKKKKHFLAWSLIAAGLLAALLFFRWLSSRSASEGVYVDVEVAGVDLTYLLFNKENEKKLEVKCEESQRGEDEKLLLKGVRATIFKADKLDHDIRISAASGVAWNEFNDFTLQGDAVIASPDVTLSSNSFALKDLDILSTREPARFQLRDLSGEAREGLSYFIKDKYVKMMAPRGVMRRDGNPYDFQARVLRLAEKRKVLILDQEASIAGAGSSLDAKRIQLQFSPDFASLDWAAGFGNSHYRMVETAADGRRQCREITAGQIKMLNDPLGRLQKIEIRGDGRVSLDDGAQSGHVRSEAIEMVMDCETQALRMVRTLTRGTLNSRGKDNVSVSAESLRAVYSSQGELAEVLAEKQCQFRTDDFRGRAKRLDYDASSGEIDISGRNSIIDSGKNRFESSHFRLRTGSRSISSQKGVKATIVPGKKSALLRAKPVFVTADAMETSRRDDASRFTGSVSLFQDEVELRAGELLFHGGALSCRGGAELKFSHDGQTLVLHGQAIDLDAGGKRIVIEGESRLKQGENSLAARRIELVFGPDDRLQDILAAGAASFRKGTIEGRCQALHWQYARQTVVFRERAEISRSGAGTTRGQELHLDLASNQIIVSGSDDRSETTIGNPQP